jgi:YVTN family beta-propeller protein
MLTFRLLGTLEVEGAETEIGSGKQRALLAYLLLRRNQAVPRDVLIDALWGDDPPETAAHALDVYASRLRRTLGDHGILDGRRGSFVLNVPDEAVDVGRFERFLAEMRGTSDPEARLRAADAGLELWRGDALADIRGEPFARPESERLDEERLVACEERLAALLELGRHEEAIGECQGFVRTHPLRERARRLLMTALYRAGRQSEALEVFREGRTILQDELGLEPSRELRELEAAILRQDENLAAPSHERSNDGATAAVARGRVRRRRTSLVVLAAFAVAGGSVAAALLLTGNGTASLMHVDFSGVGSVDPGSGRILSEVIPAISPGRLATDGKTIWTTNEADDTVSGIDTSDAAVVHTIPVGSSPSGITIGGGAVWVANTLGGTVSRIDPATARVVQTITVGQGPTAATFGDGTVWVTTAGDRSVWGINPVSGHVRTTIAVGGDGRGVAVGSGSLWVIDQSTDTVAQVDLHSHAVVRTIRVGSGSASIVSAFGSIWVANSLDGTVSRIDPRRGIVAGTVDLGGSPISVAATAKNVWVADQTNDRLAAIDPVTDRVVRNVEVGTPPVAIAASSTRLWVAAQAAPAAHRGGTLSMVSPLSSFDTADPGLTYVIASWSVLTTTNDGLVGFRHSTGSDSTQLVPDLASSVPVPADGGTTYVFNVRRGLHYSNGATVSPEDFRFVIERDFKLRSPGAQFYSGIVGGAACMTKPARCDLSRGIEVDRGASTITFHLVAPDPEFLYKLALPFAFALPAKTTPLHPASAPLPATGPYMFASYTPQRAVVLVRNPRFRVWSTAAQPDGFPDRITLNANVTLDAATTAIERGKADVLVGYGPPPNRIEEVETRYASQVHAHPYPAVQYVFLNTHRPPFNDLRVRQALNYAIDRNEIVRLHGGASVAQPTCQVLPPVIPGYQPICPYTKNPNASGTWTAPDLTKARALVAASGTGGTHVTLWMYQVEPYASELRYVATVLRALGYRVALRAPGDSLYYSRVSDSRVGAQAGIRSWLADYPAAANFFLQLTCGGFRPATPTNANLPEFCDPTTDAAVAKAERLEQTDPSRAADAWATVDRRVVALAPYAPMYVQRFIDLLSSRVGNYKYSQVWGVLVDQLWVR